ncbi:flagellin [Bartonella sp. WD12.1]|uniref:flagellin N-terminal helical domain-containing protein n=1 Tax=Bartonella sp. WD12.1 TaxID=1933903 RepID=UPI00099980D3|nr:flagellin [Bartonella sp. WD12.1]OPB29980.1 flagellin [Bartonella sp. WD12.1]OPB29987.1 flagellin [Bartonella sp. WD12.1]
MGSSILTNRSAMTALQTLRTIDSNLDKSKDRVSTGLRINSAADNTAYWSISSMMRHDSNTMSAVIDAINLGKEQVSIAATAVDLTKEALDDIQKSMISVHEKSGGDIAKLQESMKANMTNISNAVQSASFGGKNMLSSGGQTVGIAAGYRREGAAVYVDMVEVGGRELNFGVLGEDGTIDMTGGVFQRIFGPAPAAGDDSREEKTKFDEALETFYEAEKTYKELEDAVAEAKAALAADPLDEEKKTTLKEAVEALEGGEEAWGEAKAAFKEVTDQITLAEFTEMFGVDKLSAEAQHILLGSLQNTVRDAVDVTLTAGAKIGSAVNLVNIQLDFVKRLLDNVDAGIGSMVDADMNAESAKLSALQVQQQLGIQALSIANQSSQNILSLFRN